MYGYGDLHSRTAPRCCSGCGRPLMMGKVQAGVELKISSFVFADVETSLTYREHQLLSALWVRFGQDVHSDTLISAIFNDEGAVRHGLQVLMGKVRAKLERTSLRIRNTRGVGYCLHAASVGN